MRTFWDKQSWATGSSTKRVKKDEQQKLPEDFEWSSHSLETIYDFLKENYISDETFKLRYTLETLKWAIEVPGHQNICINDKQTQKLIGFISLTPFTMKIIDKEVKAVQVNFLCVHKDYRNRKLVGYLVTEAKRITEIKNRNQSIATIHNSIPGSILKASYWHRFLDVKKLVKTGFYQTDRLREKYFEIRGNSQFRKMTPKDVPKVTQILKDYFKNFKIAPVVNETWVKQWLLPRDGVVYSYLNDDTNDFFSFYSIPYDKIGSTETVNQAYLFYMTGDNFNDAFLIAQNQGFDVFNTLGVVHSEELLKNYKFLEGTGYVNYHLFDWKLNCEINKMDINVKIP